MIKSIEQGPSWEANNPLAGPETIHFLSVY